MKNIKNEIRSFGLSFLRDQKREEKKRGREKRREEEEEEEGREEQKVCISMGFLWIILDTCIDFYGFVWKKNQTINPFLMNLDLKEPYLV